MCKCTKHVQKLKDAVLFRNYKNHTYFVQCQHTEVKCFALTIVNLVRCDPYIVHTLPDTYCINDQYFVLQNGRAFNAEWIITPNIEVELIRHQ